MFLKNLKKLTGKIGFRLALWYSSLIIAAIVVLFHTSYYFLSSTLQRRDFQEIQSEISELGTEFKSGGIEGVKTFVNSHLSSRLKDILIIRFADSKNSTQYLFSPFKTGTFDTSQLDQKLPHDGEWTTIKQIGSRHKLNVLTTFLNSNTILQVGMNSRDREEILHHFRQLFVIGVTPLIIIGIIFGVILSINTLKPLRHIINTVETIDIGKMDSRVPRTGTGDELDELARLFNDMLDKINRLIKGMKDSLDNVAHDLRTPLTRLRNISENALFEKTDQNTGHDAHENILEESERILKMLDALMDISEAETGVMTLKKQTIPLNDLVYPIYDLYLMVAETKQISITCDISKAMMIFADPDRISQVIANLLDNAVKFTPENGSIFIQAATENTNLVIRISDNGMGIPESEIEQIWDRLYRGDQSRSQKGLGLGLSLVKAIVNAHKGHISVQSKPGDGTTFCLVLPSELNNA